MSAPVVPQRPARTLKQQQLAPASVPAIPPRPKRSVERSPLNDPVFSNGGNGSLRKKFSASNLPPRPPSVTLPSIGQEGSEYANIHDFSSPDGEAAAPEQERAVAGDLPLHAPTATMSPLTAKSRIQTVTRTDSDQAAAAIGKAYAEQSDKAHEYTRSGSSLGGSKTSRPASLYKDDEGHGIPSFGVTVPMYPNAGDVQAPTPSPGLQSANFGLLSSGGAPSLRHQRTKSGQHVFAGPPGSYGLHGHGVSADPFEKAWYERHPEALAKEVKGEYGPAIAENRPEWALSSDDLNKLVHETGQNGSGIGSSPTVTGVPDEEIGYLAHDEFSSRYASPRPPSVHHKTRSSGSQTHQESPLRKTSFPVEEVNEALKLPGRARSENAMEDDDDAIHIDPPSRRHSRMPGDISAEDLGLGTEDNIEDRGYGVPILASDEVAKHPESEWMQPAVPPEQDSRRSSSYVVDCEGNPILQGLRSGSRPSSRNNSLHEGNNALSRFASHDQREGTGTPLEDVKEYEPLFPDDDDDHSKVNKPKTAVEKLKRPDLARHHFPSQDIWEDTPNSLQLQTTVESPQLPEEPTSATQTRPSKTFETPEAEAARKGVVHKAQDNFLTDHNERFGKSHLKAGVLADMPSRPGMQQRFPSQDIWEDTPSSALSYTTVESPQIDEPQSAEEPKDGDYVKSKDVDNEPHHPRDEIDNSLGSHKLESKPQIPARPTKAQPFVPARPRKTSSTEKEESSADRKVPGIPDRPKPHVPARPSKPRGSGSSESVPLAKTTSAGSTGSATAADAPPVPKAKPAVPARPNGSKIAALQAGFMKDLNSRLKLGPVAPPKPKEEEKPEEEQKEKAPLADARKGRARGPQRKKPGVSPNPPAAAATVEEPAKPVLQFSIVPSWTVWQITENGSVDVPSPEVKKAAPTETAVQTEPPAEFKEPIATKALDVAVGAQPAEPEASKDLSDSMETVKPAEERVAEVKDTTIQESPEVVSKEPEVALDKTATKPPDTSDKVVQTGQQDMEFKLEGETEKFTAYLGGHAQEEGNVVVKDGKEVSVGIDEKHDSLKTGDGM